MVARRLVEVPDLHPHNSKSSECFPFKRYNFASHRLCVGPLPIPGQSFGQGGAVFDWPGLSQMPIPEGRGNVNTTKPCGRRVGQL